MCHCISVIVLVLVQFLRWADEHRNQNLYLFNFFQCTGWYLSSAMPISSLRPSVMNSDKSKFWGWLFISIGSVFFVGFFFAAVISKLLPPSNIAIIAAIQNDWYYCFLVPLTLPIVVVAVYFHWLSMNLFKHA